jgi:hypothetical protein
VTTGAERTPDALDGVAALVRDASAPMTLAQQQAGIQAVTFRLEQDRRRRAQPGRRLLVALRGRRDGRGRARGSAPRQRAGTD